MPRTGHHDSAAPSPAPRARGHTGGGSWALPAAPGSIAAPRTLIGLGAATTPGLVSCGPLLASRGGGGRDEAPPCKVQLLTEPGGLPLLPRQPWGGRAVCGFPTRWREQGAQEEGRGGHTRESVGGVQRIREALFLQAVSCKSQPTA